VCSSDLPVLDTSELLADESLRARNMVAAVEHKERGTYYTIGSPLNLSDSPVDYKAAPLLGEHNAEVLNEVMQYDAAKVEELRTAGVI
jgi:formyl-CoA transferase